MLIADTEALRAFCRELEGAPYLAVDTEFLREKTYHARLCLVQVAYGEHAAAIDPLAEGMDLAPLHRLLADASTVKVLHSASQDLGIFLRSMGHIPGPVFDTQIAASVCGFGHQPGYAMLVESMLGVAVDKTNQATENTKQFTLTSVRSEGQFNTIIYSEEDIYRRQSHRHVLFINAEDLEKLGLKDQDKVDVSNATGAMRNLSIALYDIKPGNVMCYFPEANILVPQSVDKRSRTPSFKSISVSIKKAAA